MVCVSWCSHFQLATDDGCKGSWTGVAPLPMDLPRGRRWSGDASCFSPWGHDNTPSMDFGSMQLIFVDLDRFCGSFPFGIPTERSSSRADHGLEGLVRAS